MAKTYIGVDLGGTNVRAGRVSAGKLLGLDARSIHSHGTAAEVFEDLCTTIDAVYDKSVRGIGLGVPSLVNKATGVISDTTNIPSWKRVPLKKWLEKKYRVPVHIDNDANCFALAERQFGFGRECENFVALILGTGLGAGVICNGQLYSGVECGAGEFGMIPFKDSIVEHYASGQFFQKRGFAGAELAQRAAAGDTQARKLFDEFGRNLAFAFKAILYALAPEMIVLGGSVSQSYQHFSKSLHGSLTDFAYPSLLKKLKVRVSKRNQIAVLGAAALALPRPRQ